MTLEPSILKSVSGADAGVELQGYADRRGEGLEKKRGSKAGEQTLGEFLREQGGVDEEQERIVTEARKRHRASDRAK